MDAMNTIQARFVSVLPRIKATARFHLRYFKGCRQERADLIAETIALTWKRFWALEKNGENPMAFLASIVDFAARDARGGLRLVGTKKRKDVMDPATQRRRGFVVSELSCLTNKEQMVFSMDRKQEEPPEAAAFRLDFFRWLTSLPNRDQQLVEELMIGEAMVDVATRFRVTLSRVSQMRSNLRAAWIRFNEEVA